MKQAWTLLRKVLRLAGRIVTAGILLVVVLFAYGELKLRWAKKQVEAFASQVVIGQPVAGLDSKAKEMHLTFTRIAGPDGADEGKLLVWEGFGFDRWFCDVEYKNGIAIRKRITSLD